MQIVRHTLSLSEQLPIRYLVLHALLEMVPFYEKRGFQALGEAEGETQFMYLDCLRDRSALSAYLDHYF